jgi:chromosome segregation ATPase
MPADILERIKDQKAVIARYKTNLAMFEGEVMTKIPKVLNYYKELKAKVSLAEKRISSVEMAKRKNDQATLQEKQAKENFKNADKKWQLNKNSNDLKQKREIAEKAYKRFLDESKRISNESSTASKHLDTIDIDFIQVTPQLTGLLAALSGNFQLLFGTLRG